jgi:hypothetical protein
VDLAQHWTFSSLQPRQLGLLGVVIHCFLPLLPPALAFGELGVPQLPLLGGIQPVLERLHEHMMNIPCLIGDSSLTQRCVV